MRELFPPTRKLVAGDPSAELTPALYFYKEIDYQFFHSTRDIDKIIDCELIPSGLVLQKGGLNGDLNCRYGKCVKQSSARQGLFTLQRWRQAE